LHSDYASPLTQDAILASLKERFAQNPLGARTLHQFFVDRVRRHLHIVLSFDAQNAAMARRIESNPALATQVCGRGGGRGADHEARNHSSHYQMTMSCLLQLQNIDILVKYQLNQILSDFLILIFSRLFRMAGSRPTPVCPPPRPQCTLLWLGRWSPTAMLQLARARLTNVTTLLEQQQVYSYDLFRFMALYSVHGMCMGK
jgi:hypothetical protein